MGTPSVHNNKTIEEPVNETSAMDVDTSSELQGGQAEAKSRFNSRASNELRLEINQLAGSPVVDKDNEGIVTNDAPATSIGGAAAVRSTDPVAQHDVVNNGATVIAGSVSALSDGTTSIGDAATTVSDGATATSNGASASEDNSSVGTGSPSASGAAEAVKSHGANPMLLFQLLEMGVPANLAIRALLFSGNGSVEAAFTWMSELSAEEAEALSFRPVEDDAHDWEDVEEDDQSDAFSHKMALVVDTSLKMKPGKVAAQVGHAVLGLYRVLQRVAPRQRASALSKWEITGEKMVVLRATDSGQLLQLRRKADAARLSAYMVADAGLTQIAAGSVTVLAIFGTSEEVDLVTGDLRLL